MTKEKHDLGVTYFSVPGEVKWNPELSPSDIDVFWLISLLDATEQGCFASNAYLAEWLGLSITRIEKSLSMLRTEGYIETEQKGGKRFIWIRDDYPARHRRHIIRINSPRQAIQAEGDTHPNGRHIYKELKEKKTSFGSLSPAASTDDLFSAYTQEAKALFEFWNALPGLPHTKVGDTGSFRSAMQAITNALSRGYKAKEIRSAMQDYHSLVTSDEETKIARGLNTALVGLPVFFKWSDFVYPKKGNPLLGTDCWFEEAVKGKEYLNKTYGRYIEDEFPDITLKIRNAWTQSTYFNGGWPSIQDENNFRKCAFRLVQFVDSEGERYNFDSTEIRKPQKLVKHIFGAIADDEKHTPVLPATSWLASKRMFEQSLPQYLRRIGLYLGSKGGRGAISKGGSSR